ncbi:MAG: InlB B-repeat-containing protein [Clostridia bacterium]|nr:InlB B-repeat-containing protein [Clostridia bacterium]
MKRKLLAIILAALMILAVIPAASLAKTVSASVTESKKLALLDKAWESIEAVEREAMEKKASPAEVTMAAYKAALNNSLVDERSLVMESAIQFAFTVDGMHCLYYYTARAAQNKEVKGETIVTDFSKGTGNCAGTPNVLLVGPYYGQDSSFTDQYKNEADSIAEATGGTCTKLTSTAATGPAIASNYTDKGVVIYDSHGTQSGTSSYLCLTTNSGITTTDYNNGWAVSSGSAAYIDGRYIQNHVSGTLSNCLVWMAICEGMKKSGNGTTGYALVAAGAAAVYGYSQSVTFKGDYEYEAVFWNEMKDGATMADALVTMKNQYGVPDPYGDAYPIVISPVDDFPSNPDAAQVVNCDWTLFSQDPVDLEGFDIVNNAGEVITSAAVAQGKKLTVKLATNPSNANTYTANWSVANTSVATIQPATNGKSCVITGIEPGSTTVTATLTTEAGATFTKTIALTVVESAQWAPVSEIVPGDEYLIGFVVNGTVYLAVNYNVSASNHYYNSISSNYYGYTAPATMKGNNVIGVSGNADDLIYCTWIFSATDGGTIQSAYQPSYYLRTWSNTNYADLYPDTSSAYQWTFDSNAKTLYRNISGTNRYAQYSAQSGANYMCVGSSVPTNGYVQLFKEQAIVPTTTYTVNFVDWNGTVLKTETVEEGASATAPADPAREGYTFTGWDVDFTNVTSDLTVTAQYTINSYTLTVNYVYADGSTARTPFVQSYNYGVSYSVTSPTITGYTPDVAIVTGTMGAADVTVTVTYTANETPSQLLGDVNGDGQVNFSDVTDLFAYMMNTRLLTDEGIANADVNGDGVITMDDVSALYTVILNS